MNEIEKTLGKGGGIAVPVVIERAKGNWSAYSPTLPGCVATGGTREEAERNMREAVEFHVAGLREEGSAR